MHNPTIHTTGTALAGTPQAGCTPGAQGIPDGPAGRVLCGDYPLSDWWQTLAGRWPLLVAALLTVLAARVGLAWWRRRRWAAHAARARWLELTPPVSATPATTVQLWRLLANLLPAPRWWQSTPPRLVWEVAADGAGMRAGLWVPPGINPSAVTRVVQRAWPGARLHHTTPPALPERLPIAGHRLHATVPEWLPLVDELPSTTTRRSESWLPEDDRLRAVYDGLAAAGRTGGGLLQVHISRAPARRVAVLRRATIDPRRARRAGRGRAAGLLLAGATSLVRGVLDLLTPGPTGRTHNTSRQTDPYATQLAVEARAKYGSPPHLLAAVHCAAAGPTKAAAKAATADISAGYGLVSTQLTRRRLPRVRAIVHQRWATTKAMLLVSIAEAATLAGLPTEPAAHGLPQAASRRRGAGRDTWAAPAHPTRPNGSHQSSRPGTDHHPDLPLWSIP